MVENHFKTISKLKKDRTLRKFRSSIVPLFLVNKLINVLSEDPNIISEEENASPSPPNSKIQKLNFQDAAFIISRVLSHKNKALTKMQRIKIKQSERYQLKMKEYEDEAIKLSPKLENRIICIRDNEVTLNSY